MARMACSLYWFHPLAWYALARMRREREEATDDCVLTAGEPAQAYASSLLCVARTARDSALMHLGAIPMSQVDKLEGRLASILDTRRDRSQITGKLSGVSALVTIVVLAGLAMVTASRPSLAADAEEPAREAISNEELPSQDEVILNILKLGGHVTRDEAAGNEVTGVTFTRRTTLDVDMRNLKVFTNLKSLSLSWTLVGDIGLDHISNIATLENLVLEGCDLVTDEGMAHIAKLENLRSLTIMDTSVTDAGMEELRALKKLRTLDLTGLPITDKGAVHLLELKELRLLFFCRRGDGLLRPSQVSEPMVEILKAALPNCSIMHETGDLQAAIARRRLAAAESEVQKERRRRLIEQGFTVANREEAGAAIESVFGTYSTTEYNGEQVLFVDLDNLHVDDRFVAHLAFFDDLGVLDLSRNPVSDEGIRHLAGLKDLTVVQIDKTDVTDAGLASLTGLKKLRELWLNGPLITDRGLEHLSPIASLEELMLRETRITDDGIRRLTPLKNLRKLWLTHTKISDEALAHLRQLPKLEYVDVSGTRVTQDGADAFAAAMPGCKVELWINARSR
jgi:Leucine-rich repeat (LRR) protein